MQYFHRWLKSPIRSGTLGSCKAIWGGAANEKSWQPAISYVKPQSGITWSCLALVKDFAMSVVWIRHSRSSTTLCGRTNISI